MIRSSDCRNLFSTGKTGTELLLTDVPPPAGAADILLRAIDTIDAIERSMNR